MNNQNLKKIRIDYYYYRLKKGRAEILLEKEDGADVYFIPFHYVRADETLEKNLIFSSEDDGDEVINQVSLNEFTRRKKDKGWTSLDKLKELPIRRDENLRVRHKIFKFFIDLCPREGESGTLNRVLDMYESLKVEIAKRAYVAELRSALEGERQIVLDANVKQPDPELVRKEIETLEHFRIRKPRDIPMTLFDGFLRSHDLYTYEPIDWKALGMEISPIPRASNPSFDDILDDLLEEE